MSFPIGTVSFNLDGTVFFLLCLFLLASLAVARWLSEPWRNAQKSIREAESGTFHGLPVPGKPTREEQEQDTEDIPAWMPDEAHPLAD